MVPRLKAGFSQPTTQHLICISIIIHLSFSRGYGIDLPRLSVLTLGCAPSAPKTAQDGRHLRKLLSTYSIFYRFSRLESMR